MLSPCGTALSCPAKNPSGLMLTVSISAASVEPNGCLSFRDQRVQSHSRPHQHVRGERLASEGAERPALQFRFHPLSNRGVQRVLFLAEPLVCFERPQTRTERPWLHRDRKPQLLPCGTCFPLSCGPLDGSYAINGTTIERQRVHVDRRQHHWERSAKPLHAGSGGRAGRRSSRELVGGRCNILGLLSIPGTPYPCQPRPLPAPNR